MSLHKEMVQLSLKVNRKIQKAVDKKNISLYNKKHVNELSLYHDKAKRDNKRMPFTPAKR